MAGNLVTDKEMVNALDDIMLSLHEEVEPARKPGEFTTAEYAKKNGINMSKAHKELTRLNEHGRIEKRKGSKDCYWRKVES